MAETREPYLSTATEELAAMADGAFSARECWPHTRRGSPRGNRRCGLRPITIPGPPAAPGPSLPGSVKNIIDVVGQPTMMGADFHDAHPATRETGSIAIMRAAGCAFVGKTVTNELGHRHPGPTRSPHNLAHTPGASSSGSAAACYALGDGVFFEGRPFWKGLMGVTRRTLNLTAIVFFLLGCVGIFQFFLAKMGWPQEIASWAGGLGLSKYTFLFGSTDCLLVLSMWLTGVAILVLTVPIYFPVALSLGVDPMHLGILTALCIEIGSVIPPVGLNLFAVSGVSGLPLTQVIRGSFPFCVPDTVVLVIVLLFPMLALWLPVQLITSHF